MHKGQFVTGNVTGTGSAINVELGFLPAYVVVTNETDPGTYTWINTMADAEMVKVIGDGTQTFPTTNGISLYVGSSGSASKGFTIGADTDMNGAADVLHYVAIGNE